MAERKTRELFLARDRAPTAPSTSTSHGAAHPAMHGIIRIFAELDGETVVKTDVEIGYLPPGLREGLRGGSVQQRDPVHRPPQLRLAPDQQLRLHLGDREAARHRDPRSAASTSA